MDAPLITATCMASLHSQCQQTRVHDLSVTDHTKSRVIIFDSQFTINNHIGLLEEYRVTVNHSGMNL